MSVALLSVFDVEVVHNIDDFIPRRPNVDWKEIGGYTMIYKTKHLVTYTGRGDGGYVYFIRRGSPGGTGGIGFGAGSQPMLILMMV